MRADYRKEIYDDNVVFEVCDWVWLGIESYKDRPYILTRIQHNKHKIYVSVEMFGREIEIFSECATC